MRKVSMVNNKKPEDNSKTIHIQAQAGKSRDAQIADIATNGIVNSATLVTEFSKGYLGEVNITECIAVLTQKAKNIHEGDLKGMETLLINQALALDSIFSALAIRARFNMNEYVNAAEKYMRLALKAQGQCRATLETLAIIKNPQPYIQNNKAEYQQVNNELTSSGKNNDFNQISQSHARENSKITNGLLEDKIHEQKWLDAGKAETASKSDKGLEALGAKHRSKD